jgi:hypothetical protein
MGENPVWRILATPYQSHNDYVIGSFLAYFAEARFFATRAAHGAP